VNPKAFSALCLLSAAACSGGEEAAPAGHPNLVLIVADDLGWGDVGYHAPGAPTPNIDRLAREGVALDRFYAYPVCSPSRAALMTGRTPMSLDFVRGPAAPWEPRELPLEERTMGEVFRDAGYGTAMVGKWHLGLTRRELWPDRRGFDHFYGFLGGAVDYFAHKRSGGLDWQRDGVSVKEPGYTTDLLAAQAVRDLEQRDKARPFFLFVSFNAPHTPLGAPAELIRKHSGEPDPARRKYLAAVDSLDQAIGRIRTALEKEGMAGNTLLVFLSDNGASPHKGGSNLPLRGGKFDTFEGAIRVPAVLYWPGHLTGGKVSEQVVTLQDLLPTLAAACGFTPRGTRPLDGRNLLPQLLASKEEPREDLFFSYQNQSVTFLTLLQPEWKFTRFLDRNSGRSQDFLFRIRQDPGEKKNLAAREPDRVRDLWERIERWQAPHPLLGPPPDTRQPPGWHYPADWTDIALKKE